MKKLLFAFVMLFSLPVMAQQGLQMPTNVNSSSQTAATSSAANQGVSLGVYSYGGGDTTTTLKTTPGLGGQAFYGSYSSDSCRQSAGGGGVVPTFGLNIVAPSTDDHCQAMREFERTMQGANYDADEEIRKKMRQAGRDILCQVSERLQKAYSEQGLCSARFAEKKEDATVTAQRQEAQRLPPTPMYQ